MSGVSELLDAFYGTTKTASASSEQADPETQAQVELFCKVAADQGIDIANMPDDQVAQLYNQWLTNTKTAGEGEASKPKGDDGEDGEKKKHEAAEREFEEKKAFAEDFNRFDFYGRQMAHAYVNELRKIAASVEDGDAGPSGAEKQAGIRDSLKSGVDFAKKQMEDQNVGGSVRRGAKKYWQNLTGHDIRQYSPETAAKNYNYGLSDSVVHKLQNEGIKRTALTAGGTAAGAAAAGAGIHHALKKKESSAIDQLALERAVVKAAESGYDPDQAAERIHAAAVLDLLGESTKVASASNVEHAIDIRALEILETAGYPVTWAA